VLDALAHQRLPFERLVEVLAPERRGGAGSPLIDVMFSVELAGPRALELPDCHAEIVPLTSGAAKLDLSLELELDADDRATLVLELAADRFSAAFGANFLDLYVQVLDAAMHAPERPLASIPLLDDASRSATLAAARGVLLPTHPPIRAALAELAQRDARAIALIEGSRQLDRGELELRVRVLAERLRHAGLAPGQLVALVALRRLEWVIALLALLELGVGCLGIDPSEAPARVRGLLDEAGIRRVLGPAALAVPAALEHIAWEHDASAALPELGPLTSHACAFAFATSGSTGKPKLVTLSEAAIADYCFAAIECYGLREGDRSVLFSSLTFDACLEELFPVLLAGGAVVLRDDDMLEPRALLAACREQRVSVLGLPTAYLQAGLDDWQVPPSLRVLIVGGERLSGAAVQAWQRVAPGVALYNTYGPTESAIVATIARVDTLAPDVISELGVPIGRPRAGARVYVLDERFEPCPPGMVGELMIAGPCLAEGYLARPALTAASFVPNPHDGAGARLYRSGDLARVLPDGQLAFVGRRDAQVKLRGHRVELGEIEAVLAGHPAVRELALVVRERARQTQLIAYLVGQPLAESELRAELAARLPSYMQPTTIVWLPALPRTHSGKLDRAALPEGPEPAAATQTLPADPLERAIAELWCELLGRSVVARDDDFFALGGHSLLALRVLAGLRERLGIELTLSEFFAAPSVAALARTSRELATRASAPAIQRVERKRRERGDRR
jgi:amino acid adenylation domain-containing protein